MVCCNLPHLVKLPCRHSSSHTKDLSEASFSSHTCQMLISALEDSLCTHPALLPHVMPFLSEQLVNDLTPGRLHAMHCLVRLSSLRSPSILRTPVSADDPQPVGVAIGARLFENATDSSGAGADAELSTAALATISSLAGDISVDPAGKYLNEWRLLCEPILASVAQKLEEGAGEGLRAREAVRVAQSIAGAGLTCAAVVFRDLMPILLSRILSTCSQLREAVERAHRSSGATSDPAR